MFIPFYPTKLPVFPLSSSLSNIFLSLPLQGGHRQGLTLVCILLFFSPLLSTTAAAPPCDLPIRLYHFSLLRHFPSSPFFYPPSFYLIITHIFPATKPSSNPKIGIIYCPNPSTSPTSWIRLSGVAFNFSNNCYEIRPSLELACTCEIRAETELPRLVPFVGLFPEKRPRRCWILSAA